MATSPPVRFPVTVSISGCSRLFTVKLTEPEEPVGKKEDYIMDDGQCITANMCMCSLSHGPICLLSRS